MDWQKLSEILKNVSGVTDIDLQYCSTQEFHFRFLFETGQTHIAIRDHFDRWANSVDFVYYKIPETVFEMQALILAALRMYNVGNWEKGMGQEMNIAGAVRKAKQVLKQAEKQKNETKKQAVLQEFVGKKKKRKARFDRKTHRAPASV